MLNVLIGLNYNISFSDPKVYQGHVLLLNRVIPSNSIEVRYSVFVFYFVEALSRLGLQKKNFWAC